MKMEPQEATDAHPKSLGGQGAVTVVVTVFNDARFLPGAMASIAAQIRAPEAIIVVDDGSTADLTPDVSAWPGVSVIRKENGGLSSARNAGLAAATSEFVLFLDVDDRLAPGGVESGRRCLLAHKEAAFCYGAYRRVGPDGANAGSLIFNPIGPDPFLDFLLGNRIGMHATVLYRADALREIGGFDESLRLGEDYDLYLRLAAAHGVASHAGHVADYHWHGGNVSARHRDMLVAILAIHDRYKSVRDDHLRAWQQGRREWRRYYMGQMYWELRREPRRWARAYAASALEVARADPAAALSWSVQWAARILRERLPPSLLPVWPPRIGKVRLGDLASTRPVSMDFGFDRGLPVDRFYIETFLAAQAASIRGRVLEIGDASYSRRFGGDRIERQDVLHVSSKSADVTIVGDISQAGVLPADAFDCIIFTQTLHIIYDVRAALRHLHASLKPGGVLLMTAPGISPIDRGEWGDHWYWSFTKASTRLLLDDVFRPEDVDIEVHGNVFAAVSFLHGLSTSDLDPGKLEPHDPAYPVIITTRACKHFAS